jgi:hypothetical protein
MKKGIFYALTLMIGAAALTSSCSSETDYYDETAAFQAEHNKFAEVFEQTFGKVAPNVTWGFNFEEEVADSREERTRATLTNEQICALTTSYISGMGESARRNALRQLLDSDVNIGLALDIHQLDAFGFKRIICEDLNVGTSDFDYNDAVFDAKRIEEASDANGGYATFVTILRAEGAHKAIYVGNPKDANTNAYEVHAAFGVTLQTFVNTVRKAKPTDTGAYWTGDKNPVVKIIKVKMDTKQPTLLDLPVYVDNNPLPLTAMRGEPAEKMCVDTDYSWLEERVHMEAWYPTFKHYISGTANTSSIDTFSSNNPRWRDTYWYKFTPPVYDDEAEFLSRKAL